jgi:hypothetical protein
LATLRDISLKEFTAPVYNGSWRETGILNKEVFDRNFMTVGKKKSGTRKCNCIITLDSAGQRVMKWSDYFPSIIFT